MQCKNISTIPILNFISSHGCCGPGTGCNWYFGDENDIHQAFPEGVDDRLLLAKMRTLFKRDLVSGCSCGCRGDYVLTEKGLKLLSEDYA